MKLNGVNYPNFDKGYKTEITFPFETSKLGNNKISTWDAGSYYDQYKCSGSVVLNATQVQNLFDLYNDSQRGNSITLTDCIATGFYPFSPAVADTSYTVYIDEIKNVGAVDVLGKRFKIELSFLWEFPSSGGASTISWNNPLSYCKEGSLTFANYSNIAFPESGFKIKKGHDVVNQNYKGNQFYGVNFPYKDNEWNQSIFELKLRTNLASNIIYNLVNTYRNNTIFIEGSNNYYIFGHDQGDATQYSVKLYDPKIVIQHDTHEDFKIEIDVVKV